VARSVASSKIKQMNIPPPIFNAFFISTSYRWPEREFHPKSATDGKFLFQIVRLFLQIYLSETGVGSDAHRSMSPNP
jgi:hypothetical protein